MTHKEHLALGKQEVRNALIQQVAYAAQGDAEHTVRTVISRAMWHLWCVATGGGPHSNPTMWSSDGKCHRVYGSETIIIESEDYFSYSHKP